MANEMNDGPVKRKGESEQKNQLRPLMAKERRVASGGLEREIHYLRLIVKEAHALEMRLLSNPRSQQLKSIMVPGEKPKRYSSFLVFTFISIYALLAIICAYTLH